jgi:hypothetical protein
MCGAIAPLCQAFVVCTGTALLVIVPLPAVTRMQTVFIKLTASYRCTKGNMTLRFQKLSMLFSTFSRLVCYVSNIGASCRINQLNL